ncbi:MAG: hypothetical protein IPM04_15800 [Saprospiraceae bacterium]|nr:hypothetical protein [Candidatus Brachybacter algidus]
MRLLENLESLYCTDQDVDDLFMYGVEVDVIGECHVFWTFLSRRLLGKYVAWYSFRLLLVFQIDMDWISAIH